MTFAEMNVTPKPALKHILVSYIDKSNNLGYSISFSMKDKKGYQQPQVVLYTNPTGNCQVMGIAYMNSLLNLIREDGKDPKEIILGIKEALCVLYGQPNYNQWPENINIKMLSFDIRAELETKLDILFKDFKYAFKTPYVSTRGTNMIMGLIIMNL